MLDPPNDDLENYDWIESFLDKLGKNKGNFSGDVHDFFRKYTLPERWPLEYHIINETTFSNKTSQNNPMRKNGIEKEYKNNKLNFADSVTQNNSLNGKLKFYDNKVKKNDKFVKIFDKDFNESSLSYSEAKYRHSHGNRIHNTTENSDSEEILNEDMYNKQNSMEKENESENLLENFINDIPFYELRENVNSAFENISNFGELKEFSNIKPNFFLKRAYRDISPFQLQSPSKVLKNSDKVVMTNQFILKSFILDLNPTGKKSGDFSKLLWLRYRKYALIPRIKETLQLQKLKISDIFKLLNASTSILKKSNIYDTNCETCSVIYKMMLDGSFKADPELMKTDNSSILVLMNKPEIISHPHKRKVLSFNKKKSEKLTKNDTDDFIIQMNIDFLFLSEDDYKKLKSEKMSENNTLWSTPWKDVNTKFVFRIPESFISQSKLMKLRKFLEQNNLKPAVKELITQGELEGEFDKILFSFLLKIHESNEEESIKKENNSLILPPPNSKMNEYRKSDNVQEGTNSSEVNLQADSKVSQNSGGEDPSKAHGENSVLKSNFEERKNGEELKYDKNSKAFDGQKSFDETEDGTTLNLSRDTFHQPDNNAVQINVSKTDTMNNWSRKNKEQKMSSEIRYSKMSQSNTATIRNDDRKLDTVAFEKVGRRRLPPELKNLEARLLGKIISSENTSNEKSSKLEANSYNVSDTLNKIDEKISAKNNQQQDFELQYEKIKETQDSFGFKDTLNTTITQFDDRFPKTGDDTSYSLNGIEELEQFLRRSGEILNNNVSGDVIHFSLVEDKKLHHRAKRQSSLHAIPQNHWCPIMSIRRNGNLDCLIWTSKKKCKLQCHSGFTYNGQRTVEMCCQRRGNSWSPDINKPCGGWVPLVPAGRDLGPPEIPRPAKGGKGKGNDFIPAPPGGRGRGSVVRPGPIHDYDDEDDDYYS